MPAKSLSININEILIISISLFYAGISSSIIFGFRVIDFLIPLIALSLLRKRVSATFILLSFLWLTSVGVSFIIGVYNNNPFVMSDTRFFLILIISAYVGYELGRSHEIDFYKVYYLLLLATVIIYTLIPLFDGLRFYYIPEEFQKDEHANTVFGPSTILINYLFVYLALINRKQPASFYFFYLLFAIFIYNLRISRTDFALMILFFIWALLYRFGEKVKTKHVLAAAVIILVGAVLLYFNQSERIEGIFNPGQDSSFVYRILSNNEFLRQFGETSLVSKLFGFGMGATLVTYFNDWFGEVTFTILDNGPLTFLMKTGWFGLVVFTLILGFALKGIKIRTALILLLPILLSLALFSHIIYNLLYILGFYMVCFKLRLSKGKEIK